MQTQFLADTVEYNHLIVDRVTDSGKDSTDEGLVNLHAEGQETPKQSICTQDEYYVNNQGGDRTDRESNIAETYQDVDEDGDNGQDHTPDSTVSNILGDRGSNLLAADDRTAGTYVAVDEGLK